MLLVGVGVIFQPRQRFLLSSQGRVEVLTIPHKVRGAVLVGIADILALERTVGLAGVREGHVLLHLQSVPT